MEMRAVGRILRLSKDLLLWLSGRKYNIVKRIINTRKDPIQLYWWQDYTNGIHNFGDEITKDIILKIFGFRSELANIEEAEMAGVGSILELVGERHSTAPIHIWGSGFIQPKDESRLYNETGFIVHAVRGETTLKRLKEITPSKVALGDPGLLANVVYPKSRYRSDKVGVVVHYAESNLPVVARLRMDPRFMVINPLDAPESVAVNITSCKLVLSSSLHGLIFADSFGVPNKHILLSERLTGGDYKFKDYYSVTGRSYGAIVEDDMFDDGKLNQLITSYQAVDELSKIQRQLVRSFPRNIR